MFKPQKDNEYLQEYLQVIRWGKDSWCALSNSLDIESDFVLLFQGFHCGKRGKRQGKGIVTCHKDASTHAYPHTNVPTVHKFEFSYRNSSTLLFCMSFYMASFKSYLGQDTVLSAYH